MSKLFFFLLLHPLITIAQTKATFFPKYSAGEVIEERIFKDKIERSLERRGRVYRFVVNYQKLGRITSEVARPIHLLSQYAVCSTSATGPLQVSSHFEPAFIETYFECVSPPDYDPVKLRKNLGDRFCNDQSIVSEAQRTICKELQLK